MANDDDICETMIIHSSSNDVETVTPSQFNTVMAAVNRMGRAGGKLLMKYTNYYHRRRSSDGTAAATTKLSARELAEFKAEFAADKEVKDLVTIITDDLKGVVRILHGAAQSLADKLKGYEEQINDLQAEDVMKKMESFLTQIEEAKIGEEIAAKLKIEPEEEENNLKGDDAWLLINK